MKEEIQNIAFDLGGVLLTNDSVGLVSNNKETKDLLGASGINLSQSWIRNWLTFRIGKTSEDEFFSRFINGLGRKATDELIQQMKDIYREKVEALPFYSALATLHGRYKLYAVTNISREWLEFKTNKFNLDEQFRGIVASGIEGVAKPKPAIFKKFVEKYGVRPQETLFVDDQWRNTFIARVLGFNTIWFRNESQATHSLKHLSE